MRGFRRHTAMTNLRLLAVSVAFAVLGVVLLSCGDRDDAPGPGTEPGQTRLDVTYVVTGVTDGGEPRSLVQGSEIRLRFDGDRLGISAGCNAMGGTYTLDGTRLTVSALSMTEMGCDAPLMEQDTWVAGLFERDVQLTRGAEASLISGEVVLTLADREQVSPDRPLVGTKWVLDSIGSDGADGAVSSVPAGVTAWITLGRDGTFTVNDGCNGGGGNWVDDTDAVIFSDLVTDLRACVDPAVQEVAAAVRKVLDGTVGFVLEERALRLSGPGGHLGFRAD